MSGQGSMSEKTVRLRRHRYGVASWMIAGVLGMAAGVGITLARPFDLPTLTTSFVAVGCGWLVMTLFSPWRRVLSSRADRAELRRLARRVRRISKGERRGALQQLPVHRHDEIGELSRAIHAVMAEVLTNRQVEQRLRRDMDHSIRKETQRRTARLAREAHSDPLTGLGNRRALEVAIDAMVRERSDVTPIVAMVLDMDKFKAVNDTLGHETGDECLRFMGELLRTGLRADDIAVRWGGDEFVVLMPGQELEPARQLAARLSELFNQMVWPHRSVDRPTLSIGLGRCTYRTLGDGQQVLREADEALYRAKRGGRDQVVMYEAA